MKVIVIILLTVKLICIITSVHGSDFKDALMKIQKVSCSSSGITMEKHYCRVRPVDRKVSYLNYGAYLKKTTKNLFASYALHHRPLIGGNYVRIMNFGNLNVCNLVNLAVSSSIFEFGVNTLNGSLLKGLIHKCPYLAGFVRVENATFNVELTAKWDFMQRFPNGEYRADLKVFNRLDDNIMSVSIFYIFNIRDNSLSSYDKM